MMRVTLRPTPEVIVLAVLLALSLLGLIFMGSLVAPPKMLMGRALTSLQPNLFPSLILIGIALTCAVNLFQVIRLDDQSLAENLSGNEWMRGVVFFAILTVYALTMEPLGFLLSSALAIAAVSWQLGNRSYLQILILSILAPVLLYLAATRLLAVSLPELNVVELAYSRMLGE